MDIIMMQRDIIDFVKQTTDSKELAVIYDLITKRKKKKQSIETVETVVEKPRKKIPVAEIKKGVTLEEIKASQETKPRNYDKIVEMFADEEWEQSLEELLESID